MKRWMWLAAIATTAGAAGGCGSSDEGPPIDTSETAWMTPVGNDENPSLTPGPNNTPGPTVGPPSPTGTNNPIDGPTPAGPEPATEVPNTPGPGAMMDENCDKMGLDLDGMMYSPGGELLPHPCQPFHPTDNNPYAVKCTDAWSFYKTTFPGDDYCILPPEPGKGIQIGVHPQGDKWYEQVSRGDLSGYDNVPDEFLMPPGSEEERNYRAIAPNDARIDFYRSYTRMRPGSHHMIVAATSPSGNAEMWTRGNAIEGIFGGTSLPGAQRPDENVPQKLEKPPEDVGLYRQMPGPSEIVYDMHHFNAGDQVTLKEAWQNFWFEEDKQTLVRPILGLDFGQVSSTFAQPGETRDHHWSWNIGSEIRLIDVFGHRHAWTSNFSAWVEHSDGSNTIVYQSFDWYDMPTYRYDSITENPTPEAAANIDGAYTGIMTLKAGDQLHFNCHMVFTEERAVSEDAPSPTQIGTLRFANQAYEGEMCILFGSTSGGFLASPTRSTAPLPDFATTD